MAALKRGLNILVEPPCIITELLFICNFVFKPRPMELLHNPQLHHRACVYRQKHLPDQQENYIIQLLLKATEFVCVNLW